MSDPWIAALPMYDYPELAEAHDAFWRALAERLIAAGWEGVPRSLTRALEPRALWAHPRLLLGQGCEYPLQKCFRGCVRLVASPRYRAPGCESARYRSAIVVRTDDPALGLRDLQHRRCVVNEMDSNSGMNLLRLAIAPYATGGQFFSTLVTSGSHRRSAELIAEGAADVAALDCVSLAHLRRFAPALIRRLRVLAWTASSPSLPFITSTHTAEERVAQLRSILTATAADPSLAAVCDRLLLEGFDCAPDEQYTEVLGHERAAAALGYPLLA